MIHSVLSVPIPEFGCMIKIQALTKIKVSPSNQNFSFCNYAKFHFSSSLFRGILLLFLGHKVISEVVPSYPSTSHSPEVPRA